ncbi:PIN domain nuclease [bacterium (Candidatus Blackallbacteria) CG17_big_fil_post_rev_8_21_14_2_50_48_46]|uniref:PIN domain nuclease n=1 Tax=bacterium (Candidatus Blackallbacteria) CG17_big_fil_post_rev_8_21_14_2_50_48_46 TaxID=2014261 RepID=A0A2M7GAV0_9BACT|nr:MAG: PIN domain nuclease [bacterium (Candidatus Blackallbacteria) CG18_big_fil_WC_8_21_14_2_50_49_26]PIW19305.1 MAG: PIN domain nuclease [bacterium (Candidatus Blackallbacteria) CG17_big_fil_post_rev_8_21_14_2_50_48_46]PIW49090.1 MAG: PIN domain nuclease [bacterium (Candidatus Blackallbacteria) CG13_big_fil_rev_8_21_14_2_50_49_14]
MATLWEMTIKVSLGKLRLNKPLESIFHHITAIGFYLLPTHTHHFLTLEKLPFHHRDPFDRLLIAQCMAENMKIINNDQIFDLYFDKRFW